MKALSIRQPWAWAIIAGHKKYENRIWETSYRGPLLIHAGRAFYEDEYRSVLKRARRDSFTVPDREAFERGGIIGLVDLVDIVTKAKRDPWFAGPFGWRLENPRPLLFTPWTGQQKLFNVPDEAIEL
jgi:hypothetical protein